MFICYIRSFQLNGLKRSLSSAQADHQAALQQVAVAEAQKQQALQDGQEQVRSCMRFKG